MQLLTKKTFLPHICNFVQNYVLFDTLKKEKVKISS